MAALVLVWRLVRRESVQPAVSGFIGVGICALIAWLVGAAKGYFLLGIWMSLLWAAVFGLSILIRRPVVGYIWSWVNGHGYALAHGAPRCRRLRYRDADLGGWCSAPGSWCSTTSTTPTRRAGWASRASRWAGR